MPAVSHLEIVSAENSGFIHHVIKSEKGVSSGDQAVKHQALGAKGHRFDPSKRWKNFLRLVSHLTTS